jgi:hypothetical protein
MRISSKQGHAPRPPITWTERHVASRINIGMARPIAFAGSLHLLLQAALVGVAGGSSAGTKRGRPQIKGSRSTVEPAIPKILCSPGMN